MTDSFQVVANTASSEYLIVGPVKIDPAYYDNNPTVWAVVGFVETSERASREHASLICELLNYWRNKLEGQLASQRERS